MKLCVCANLYAKYPLEEALAKFKELGIEAAEIGAGGFPGKDHCDPAVLLADPSRSLKHSRRLSKRPGLSLRLSPATAIRFIPILPSLKLSTTIM